MTRQQILLVDDDDDILNLIKFIFEDDYNIFLAKNGKDALRIFADKEIDLIITDCVMPEVDGVELIRKIRKESKVPIVAITGIDSMYLLNSLKLGATEILSKPFTRFDLEYKINNIFKKSV